VSDHRPSPPLLVDSFNAHEVFSFHAREEHIQLSNSWILVYQVVAVLFTQIASISPTLTIFRLCCTVIGTMSIAVAIRSNQTINSVVIQLESFRDSTVVSLNSAETERRIQKKLNIMHYLRLYTVSGYWCRPRFGPRTLQKI